MLGSTKAKPKKKSTAKEQKAIQAPSGAQKGAKEYFSLAWNYIKHADHRHAVASTLFAGLVTLFEDQWELSGKQNIIKGTHISLNVAFFLTHLAANMGIGFLVGDIADKSNAIKKIKNEGRLASVSKQIEEAKAPAEETRIVCRSRGPLVLGALAGGINAFLEPLMLSMINTNHTIAGIDSNAASQVTWKVWVGAWNIGTGFYAGYVLAFLLRNINDLYASITLKPGALLNDDVENPEIKIAATPQPHFIKRYPFTVLMAISSTLAIFISNVWMVSQWPHPSLLGKDDSNNAWIYLFYCGTGVLLNNLVAFAADRVSFVKTQRNIKQPRPLVPENKCCEYTYRALGAFLGILQSLTVAENIGIMHASVPMLAINDTAPSAQIPFKCLVLLVTFSHAIVGGVVLRSLWSDTKDIFTHDMAQKNDEDRQRAESKQAYAPPVVPERSTSRTPSV